MNDIQENAAPALEPAGRRSRRTPVSPAPQAELALPATAAAPLAQARPAQSMTPMDMLAIAVQRGAGVDELGKLWEIAEKVRQQQAQQAFITAMNLFKQNPPTIEKTRGAQVDSRKGADASFAYKYANLADVCNGVIRALAAVNISHSWASVQDSGQITVRCTLTHEQGHSTSTLLVAGLDTTGGKNNLQALGSTVSYLERYTLLAVCGLAVDDEQDDDGASGITGADRAELRADAAEMRAAAGKAGDNTLLGQARAAADKGHGELQRFLKSLEEPRRRELAGQLDELSKRASAAKV